MTSPETTRPSSPVDARERWGSALLALAVLAAFALVLGLASVVSGRPPLPGRLQADAFTTTVSITADLLARLAAVGTLGALAGIALFTQPRPDHTLSESGRRLAALAARTGQLWLWSSILLTFANAAYVNGVPLVYTLNPTAWRDFQVSTPSSLAWLLSAIVGAGCVLVSYAAKKTAPFALALVTGGLALTFVAVTGNVTVGLNHDWATDSAIWLTLAMVVVVTWATAVLLLGDAEGLARQRLTRYRRTALPLLLLAAAGHAVIAWQQLAGHPLLGDLYGQVSLGLFACLALLAGLWLARRLRPGLPITLDAVVLLAYLALLTAENHVPSPRFTVPQNIQINYLGYEMDVPATVERLLGLGRPNALWVGLAALAIGSYLWGVVRMRRQGGRWPVQRTLAWLAGWGLMLFLAVTGFWEYSTVVYSWHMFVHMTVNMLVPALCVLGGPLTLLAQASADGPGTLPGPRELLASVAEHRPFGRVLSPPVLWVNYVGSLFLIYYTPLFPWLMRYHWAHQLMLLYFMATGYLFFNLIVGIDRGVHDLPHLIRLALVISIMPFHAIFAVGILSSKTLIGGNFYQAIALPWVGDLMADQNIAGQITWILGEVPLFIVVIALAAQWFTADSAEGRAIDHAQDSGEDDSFDAYNEMLAQLAERDRRAARKGEQ